jgi:hypothetical protein
MRIRRRWKLLGLALVGGAVATTVAQTVIGGGNKAQIGTGSVSALARAAGAEDDLPANVLALPFADRNFASPSGAGSRLLKTDGSLSLYAVPGKGRLLCLIEVDSAAGTSGGSCADRQILLTGSIFMADVREDGRKDIVGLVGDGHTYAEADGRRVPTDNNAFILRGVESKDVTLGSPTASQLVEVTD